MPIKKLKPMTSGTRHMSILVNKDLGLVMGSDSRQRREYLGEELRIGYSNGKQLLKRLEMFGVTLAEVEEAMERYEK